MLKTIRISPLSIRRTRAPIAARHKLLASIIAPPQSCCSTTHERFNSYHGKNIGILNKPRGEINERYATVSRHLCLRVCGHRIADLYFKLTPKTPAGASYTYSEADLIADI